MKLTLVTALTGLVLLAAIVELLRRRQLREKYALLWFAVALVVGPLALFPRLLDRVAEAVGVVSGVSLVLFLGVAFLLLVCVHLSWEVSRLEEETRALAEHLALVRMRVPADPPAGVGRPSAPAGAEPVPARADIAGADGRAADG